jgi:hypothetical protein
VRRDGCELRVEGVRSEGGHGGGARGRGRWETGTGRDGEGARGGGGSDASIGGAPHAAGWDSCPAYRRSSTLVSLCLPPFRAAKERRRPASGATRAQPLRVKTFKAPCFRTCLVKKIYKIFQSYYINFYDTCMKY